MFSAALNLAPAAASSLATAARGVGSGNSGTGSTGGGIGSGLGGMSFMSPLTDAKNTMEKRLGSVTGTSNKSDIPSNTKNKMSSLGGSGVAAGMHPTTREYKSNINPSLVTADKKQFQGGGLPVATTSIRQPTIPISTTSTSHYNTASELQFRGQYNAPNALNATIAAPHQTQSISSIPLSSQQSSTAAGGLLSCSNTNAQSKRCRFASTTLSGGNETTIVTQGGQDDRLLSNSFRDYHPNVTMTGMVHRSDNSNLPGGTRRSRSPGPKQTPHLLSNMDFNHSRISPQHNKQKHAPTRIIKNSMPYSSQPPTSICSSNAREDQSNFISSSHSSYVPGNSMVTLTSVNATPYTQDYTKTPGNKSCDTITMSTGSILNSKISSYDAHSAKKEGIKFSAPLMMEQAEELMILASTGKPLPEGLQIREDPPQRPNGGTMYLARTSDPSSKDAHGLCSDGYPWVEILYQADLTTPRGNCLDYRHYYIGSHQVPGVPQTNALKTRTSSRFRREAYTLGNLTLFAYIGDEREGSLIASSRASSMNVDRDGVDSFNSLPRSHRYDKISSIQAHTDLSLPSTSNQLRLTSNLGERCSQKTNLYGSTIIHGNTEQGGSLFTRVPSATIRPRSLDRADLLHQRKKQFSNSHLDNLDLHRLQTRALSTADTNKINSMYGGSLSSAIISSALRSSTMLAKSNTNSVFEELAILAEELAGGKLVKNLTLFPSIQITLVHPDMTREFEQSCQVLYADHPDPSYLGLEEGILLFYDITFPLGRIHATLLTYINCCYEGNPVMPLAVNLHERKFKSSHQLFWARIVGDIPALQKYRFPLMIDDAEPAVHLAVRTQAPNLVQLEGWTHRFRDIDRHLRSKGYGEEAVSYYKACIGYLLSANSKQAMHDRYRKEFECVWPKDFVHYYRNKLLPRSGRLGRWAMSKMNIKEQQYFSPHTNPQERFHMLCRNFSGWETLSIDQLVRCFYLLFVFFVSETTYGNGSSTSAYVIKSTFRPYFLQMLPRRTHSNYATNTLHPADIREYVLSNYPREASSGNVLKRPFDPLRQFYLTASTAEHGGIKHHAGIEDVLQLGDALENMFYDDEDNDPLYAHKISTNDMDASEFDAHLSNLLSSHGLGNSGGGTGGRNTARFLSNGNLPSSAIGNFNMNQYNRHQQVPSPAPNGRVPSPAPGDAAGAAYALSTSDQFPQASFISNVTSNASSSGNVTIPMRSTHSSLSTIPEVPAELNRSSNVMNVIKPNQNMQQRLCTEASTIHKSTGSIQHHPPLMSQPSQQKRSLFQQSSRYNPSISKTIGGGIIRGVHPAIDKFQSATAPRFGVPATCQNTDMLNHYPPDILVHSTAAAVGPLTSVSGTVPSASNNWQEQSFDSSIVTESHYDASFESEIPPMGLSIDRGIGQNGASNSELMPTNQASGGLGMSSASNINNTVPLTTSQRQQKNVFQQRKGGGLSQTSLASHDNNEMGKVNSKGGGLFGIAGFGNSATEKNSQNHMMQTVKQSISGNKMSTSMVPATNSTSSNPAARMTTKTSTGGGIGVSSTDNVAPNSLMLWKKVQHYVVVGGAFVQAGQQASSTGGNSQNNLQQHHGNTVVATSNQSSLHQ